MFFYVYGVENEADANKAIAAGADAIGIRLTMDLSQVSIEQCREVFENLPEKMVRVGIFSQEPAYEIEELTTFCHLNCLQFISKRGDVSRYLQRVFSVDCDSHAFAWTVRVDEELSREIIKEKVAEHNVIIIGSYTIDEWIEWVDDIKPYGVGIPVQDLNEDFSDFIKLLKNR